MIENNEDVIQNNKQVGLQRQIDKNTADIAVINGNPSSSNKYYHTVTFSGAIDNSNKNFTLSYALSVESENIWIGRVFMQNDNGEDYILSGVNLSFAVAPQIGDKIKIKGNY